MLQVQDDGKRMRRLIRTNLNVRPKLCNEISYFCFHLHKSHTNETKSQKIPFCWVFCRFCRFFVLLLMQIFLSSCGQDKCLVSMVSTGASFTWGVHLIIMWIIHLFMLLVYVLIKLVGCHGAGAVFIHGSGDFLMKPMGRMSNA